MTDLTQAVFHREGSIEIFTTNQITFKHKGDKVALRGPVHVMIKYVRPNGKEKGSEEIILRSPNETKEIVCQENPQDQYDVIISDMGNVPVQPTILDLVVDKKHIDVLTSGNLIGYHPNDMVRLRGPGRFRIEYKGKSGATRRAEDVVLGGPGDIRDFVNKSSEEDLWVMGSYTGGAVPAPTAAMPQPSAGGALGGRYPEGTLIKIASSDGVYVVEGGMKKPFPSAEVFTRLGFKWEAIRVIPDGDFNAIPTGPAKN